MFEWRLIVVGLLALVLSGCLVADDPPPGEDGEEAPAAPPPAPNTPAPAPPSGAPAPAPRPPGAPSPHPDPIQASEDVDFSFDPLNMAGGEPCETPTAQCFRYDVSLRRAARMDAALTWGVPANDFDLYLYQGTERVEVSADGPPENEEALSLDLDRGSYTLIVAGWAVVQDTFSLSATFGDTSGVD